jgi:hypothetical protein
LLQKHTNKSAYKKALEYDSQQVDSLT